MSPTSAEVSTATGLTLSRADLTRAELLRHVPGRNKGKADLLVYRLTGNEIAVKDYGPRPWWVRNTVGRFLIRRETAAYRAVAGLPGLPRFMGRLGPFSLATEFIRARILADFKEGTVEPARFDRLQSIIEALHDRGVALADLNHRDVLLADDGTVRVIDLAMAWVLGPRPGRLRRRVFEHFSLQDRFSLARLRARFAGEDMAEAVAAADPGAVASHRLARRIKYAWDRLRGAPRLPPVDDHWRF